MKIILDASALTLYPLVKSGWHGGTEQYVKVLAHGLADYGHTVHLVAADADVDEQWGPNLFVWPEHTHPTRCDVLIAVHNLACAGPDSPYKAPLLVLASNGVGSHLGPNDEWTRFIDGVACFSQNHIDLLTKTHPTIPASKCHITGLGVHLSDYPVPSLHADGSADWGAPKVPGRFFFSNDPARGLWHVLDIYEEVVAQYPDASLHIGYDFERQFNERKWQSNWMSEMFWESARRMKSLPGVVNLGALTRDEVIEQQGECHIHLMPSDPPNVGSQIHGLGQLEAAACGTPLVLSQTEAFPEVFGAAADILPLPGTYLHAHERRYDAQDWADHCLEIIRDPLRWREMSDKSRVLAETMDWSTVVMKWDQMLHTLAAGVSMDEVAA